MIVSLTIATIPGHPHEDSGHTYEEYAGVGPHVISAGVSVGLAPQVCIYVYSYNALCNDYIRKACTHCVYKCIQIVYEACMNVCNVYTVINGCVLHVNI